MLNSQSILELFIHFMALLYLYDLYIQKSVSHVIVKRPKFTALSPYDKSAVQHNITYSKLVNLNNFEFLISPRVCNNESILLIIVVSSNPENYERRYIIRETWGKANNAVRIVFTFGTRADAATTRDILAESAMFGDVVQGNFEDSYENLTYKHMMGLKWMVHHCPRARYLFKSDDDTFVNYGNIIKFLVRELSPWGTKGLLGCVSWNGMDVMRDNTSKWYVPKSLYSPDIYPTYCSGMLIIYSQDIVPLLVQESEKTKYFFIDDVYVTGFLPQRLGIAHTNVLPLALTYYNSEEFAEFMRDPCVHGDFIFGPLNVPQYYMRRLWNLTRNCNY